MEPNFSLLSEWPLKTGLWFILTDLKKRELDDCNNHLYECGAGLVCRHNEYGLTKCLPFKRLGEPCSANEDCAYDSDGRADSEYDNMR